MSFVKLDGQNFESITLLLKPNTHFISSSNGKPVTGSSYVSPTRSKCIREIIDPTVIAQNILEDANSPYDVTDFLRANALITAQSSVKEDTTNINAPLDTYITHLSSASHNVRFDKSIDIYRFDPPFKYTKNTTVKNVVRNVLMPYHRHRYDNCGFWYSNYNCLNFFDNTDKIQTGSCIVYQNTTGSYNLPDEFSLNFWINPRYSKSTRSYRAGTILHLSSSICVSLVSGSNINALGEEDQFKILLQLSQSADRAPSLVNLRSPAGNYPNDLIFTSSNTLKKNHWHHVSINWGQNHNNATGSMYIDDVETKFYIPSSSLKSTYNPAGIVIGNYFNGKTGKLGGLFNNDADGALIEGTTFQNTSIATPTITANMYDHPLNAELHDIRLYNKFIDKNVTIDNAIGDVSPKNTDDMIFYLPVYFYPTTPKRSVLATPFQRVDNQKTNDPFNVSFSFGVGGKMINVENFVREFVNGQYPRLVGLFPSTMDNTVQNITADDYIYASGSCLKRNFTLLPCDNGQHSPIYDILENSAMSGSVMYQKSLVPYTSGGNSDYSIISLDYLLPTASLYPGLIFNTGSIFDDVVGAAPENPGVAAGAVLTIAQRTRDVSSNEITIFDISNLYYGNKIHPKSLILYDDNLTGSNGDIKVTIKDNGAGSLYRADCLTKQAEWNSIGNVLYEEGVVIIKTPHLPYFCKDKTDIKLKGEQSIHTFIVNIPCEEWNFTSSSNKTYKAIAPTTGANDVNLKTIYITGVNIHDDNFNVIMRAHLAQPIFKTEEDEFVIRLKQDF